MAKTQEAAAAPPVDDALRQAFDIIVREPVPDRIVDFIDDLTSEESAAA